MAISRSDVVAAVRRKFPAKAEQNLLALLDLYGTVAHEPERERVQLAIVELCQGKQEKLAELIAVAKQDYRDILCWAQIGPLPESDGRLLEQKARQLIEKWGRHSSDDHTR